MYRSDESKSSIKGIKPLESKYVNASQSQIYLREIWNNEENLIRIIVPVLNDVDSLYPTDSFYFQVSFVRWNWTVGKWMVVTGCPSPTSKCTTSQLYERESVGKPSNHRV